MTLTRPVAHQARSRQTEEQIRDAAYALIAEGGPDALTINAVASRAEVAVGSVYRRFGDKDRLLLAVQEAFAAQIRDEYSRRLHTSLRPPAVEPERAIALAVGGLLETFRAHATLMRVFLLLGTQNEHVYRSGSRASIEAKQYFERFLVDVEVPHQDRDAALDFAYLMVYSVLAHRVTQGERHLSDRPLPWDELRRKLTAATISYLLKPQSDIELP